MVTFQSQPVGILSDAKVDYVRVWKPDDNDEGTNPSADTVRIVNKETGKSLRTLGNSDDSQNRTSRSKPHRWLDALDQAAYRRLLLLC